MGLIKLGPVVVVEGKYDKNVIKQIFDCTVIDTRGFGIFSDEEKLGLLRRLASERGLLIITDSDGAGLVIRNFLKGSVTGKVFNAYIPQLEGREARKRRPGKEGLLGVEGMKKQVIIDAVKKSGAMDEQTAPPLEPIKKADFYELGFSGRANSAERRRALCRQTALPENISANSLLEVLNIITGLGGLKKIMEDIEP